MANRNEERLLRLYERAISKDADIEDDLIPMEANASNEIDLANIFAARHARELRYVDLWGRWMVWNGKKWEQESTLLAFDLARAVAREAARACRDNNEKTANGIASAKTVAAIERLAKADRRFAARIEQWDADVWALNTPGGVVDLKTGKIRPSNPDDYCTKITAVAPDDKLGCPRFLAFLQEIMGGDSELVAYLQRVFGYCLTGDVSEHALFFGHGAGGNGKGVLMRTINGIMKDYGRTAPIETFTVSNIDRHPTDVAGLQGARLVSASETEKGRQWAEAKIKQMTGGDVLSARFMRQDFFDFMPQFKLLITGNHKPSLRSVDDAIRRRFHLIPFTVKVENPDTRLSEKLEAEWPAILAWMVEGCLVWRREGLQPPKAVIDATAEYLESEDAIEAWIYDHCDRVPDAWEQSSKLFASWTAWATKAGEVIGSQKSFSQALQTRGLRKHDRKYGKGFYGLRIRTDTPWDSEG